MTVVCGGAASVPKAGIAASVVVDQSYVQSLLPPGLAFLYPYLPFMQGLQIGSVSTFCGVDPPTFSMPTASDFLGFLTAGNYGSYVNVNTFLQNVTKAYLWNSICQCVGGGLPTPVTPPTDPGNLPARNPVGVVSLPQSASCFDFTYSSVSGNGGTTNRGGPVLPVGLVPTSLLYHVVAGPAISGNSNQNWTFEQVDASNATVRTDTINVNATPNFTFDKVVPFVSSCTSVRLTQVFVSGVSQVITGSKVSAYCNGNVPNSVGNRAAPQTPPYRETLLGWWQW